MKRGFGGSKENKKEHRHRRKVEEEGIGKREFESEKELDRGKEGKIAEGKKKKSYLHPVSIYI